MAPAFTPAALEVFKTKVNVRILQIDLPSGGDRPWDQGRNFMDMKRIGSGIPLQTADNHALQRADLRVVTACSPPAQQLDDLMFAWTVAQYVKSNAIVFARRHDHGRGRRPHRAAWILPARASIKAVLANLSLAGTVVASDAFFPFRDGLDVVIDQGATCVIQPGGSMRDQEVIDAADERG